MTYKITVENLDTGQRLEYTTDPNDEFKLTHTPEIHKRGCGFGVAYIPTSNFTTTIVITGRTGHQWILSQKVTS